MGITGDSVWLPWWGAATSDAGRAALAVGLVAATAWLWVVYAWGVRRGGLRRLTAASPAGWGRDDRGTTTIEFALALVVLFPLGGMLVQAALLFSRNLTVHYAAFAAARVAIVEVPTVRFNEVVNVVRDDDDSQKVERARRAAVFALIPAGAAPFVGPASAGRNDNENPPTRSDLVDPLTTFYGGDPRDGDRPATGYQLPVPRWVTGTLPYKHAWADNYTWVWFGKPVLTNEGVVELQLVSPRRAPRNLGPPAQLAPGRGETAFGPTEAIGVRVEHDLALTVPWAGWMFGALIPGDSARHHGQWYVPVAAQYVLNNQGVPDALPPLPEVRRIVN